MCEHQSKHQRATNQIEWHQRRQIHSTPAQTRRFGECPPVSDGAAKWPNTQYCEAGAVQSQVQECTLWPPPLPLDAIWHESTDKYLPFLRPHPLPLITLKQQQQQPQHLIIIVIWLIKTISTQTPCRSLMRERGASGGGIAHTQFGRHSSQFERFMRWP